MDDLQSGKDTETSHARPDRMQAVLHFVIGFLFFIGCVMLLGGIAVALLSLYYYGDASGLKAALANVASLSFKDFFICFIILTTSGSSFYITSIYQSVFARFFIVARSY